MIEHFLSFVRAFLQTVFIPQIAGMPIVVIAVVAAFLLAVARCAIKEWWF